MSVVGSSKMSQENAEAASAPELNSAYGDDENPFKLPSDELIFSFRDISVFIFMFSSIFHLASK